MKEVFPLNDDSGYNLRNKRTFKSRRVKSMRYGTDSLAYLAPKIWELVPNEIKAVESLASFKSAIKKWKTTECPCRLCKTYIPQVGFVWHNSRCKPFLKVHRYCFCFFVVFFFIFFCFNIVN